jgi:hypothetical protein
MAIDLAPGSRETFAQKFCRHFGVPTERFDEEVLRRTLYPHARWVRRLGSRDLLSVDRSFVLSVGRLTRRRDFAGEAGEFGQEPCNRRFWRRWGRFRVSVGRMRELFDRVWLEPS